MAFLVYCPHEDCRRPNQLGSFGGKSLTLKCAHCARTFDFIATATVSIASDRSAAATRSFDGINASPEDRRPTPDPVNVTLTQAGDTLPAPILSTPSSAPRNVGRFLIRRELGEGAFGKVYEAFDPQLDRAVALKVAKLDRGDASMRVKRFLREAKAAAGLRHPHIVPVFEFGQDEDRFFIAAAFIQGRTLEDRANRVADHGRDLKSAARIVRQLAEALGYAHAQGIVHRDVKPANVMVDEKDEPLLTDFGLAARQEEAEKLTHAGAIIGTPRYMAPEQAKGKETSALPASDQYSLGVMLFEMLTGRSPFEGSAELVMMQHIDKEPPSPRAIRSDIPKDLETICLKCLEKDPARRYATCQELADDLRRWLEGDPILARRVSRAERVSRWFRRNPVVAGLLVLVGVLLVSGSIISTYLAINAERARLRADESADDAKRLAIIAAKNEETARLSEKEAKEKADLARENADKARKEAERARSESQRASKVAGFLVGLFDAADPIGFTGYAFGPDPKRGTVVTAKEILDQGSRKIASELRDQPEIRASLLTTIGGVYRTMGFQKEAKPLLEEGLQLRLKTLGPNHVDVAQSWYQLGWMHQQDGDDPRALECYDKALVILNGKPDVGDLVSRCNLNKAWIFTQEYLNKDAERLFLEVLKERTDRLGKDHYDVAIAKSGLASIYFQTGRSFEAVPLVLEAAETLKAHYGDNSVAAAMLEGQQALVAMAFNQYDDAEKHLLKVKDIVAERLGPDHIYSAWTYGFLGHVMNRARRRKDAERYFAQCVEIAKGGPAMEQPLFTRALDEYTDLLGAAGRYEEGCRVFDELLDVLHKRRGKNHRVAMGYYKAYGSYAAVFGRYQDAEKHYRAALEAAKAQPRTPFRFDEYFSSLAFVIQDAKPAEAIELYREALSRPAGRDDHVTTKTNLANLLFKRHWYSEAVPLLKSLRSDANSTPGVGKETQVLAERMHFRLPMMLNQEAEWHGSTLGMAFSSGEAAPWVTASTAFMLPFGRELQAPVSTLQLNKFFRGKLTTNDPLDRTNHGCPCQFFHVHLEAWKPYNINIQTLEFPAYLRIESKEGRTLYFNLAKDKDWNSGVLYTSPMSGIHRIVVTTLHPLRTGNFSVLVRENGTKVASTGRKEVFRMEDKLASTDSLDRQRSQSYHKEYKVKLQAGVAYRIDLESKEFDPYLRLEDESGNQVAFDDDGGDGLNARIVFNAPASGTYRIVATTYPNRQTGRFLLRVSQ